VIADPNSPVEIYDLKRDPGEKNDLAKRYPEIVTRMRTVMQQQHVENEDFPLTQKAKQ
jgi:hypothetical protein